jgi:hypothetical protein
VNPLGKDAEHEAKILDAYRDYVASVTQEERRDRWTKVAKLKEQRQVHSLCASVVLSQTLRKIGSF